MKNGIVKNRSEIAQEFKWDIERMYPNEALFDDDLNISISLATSLSELKGHIMDSPNSLLDALEKHTESMQNIERAYTYSHMKKDEDNGNTKYNELYSKAVSTLAKVSALSSFLVPEILESNVDTIKKYINEEPRLALYQYVLDKIMLEKPHTLSSDQEFILASLSETLDAPDEIFSALNDVDLVFGKVTDENGEVCPITHATFVHLMESDSREIRKETFEKMYSKYRELNNTISTAYNFNVKTSYITSNLRKYDSCLDAALSGDKIPADVYTNLLSSVTEALPLLHKYVRVRKRALKINDLHMYDVYKPLVKPLNSTYTYEEAVDLACEALLVLGEDYVKVFREGVTTKHWVDIYENKGKTSGAYSFGCYDSYPYILMNFSGKLNDVFTLVHEGGHSMHSYLSRKKQPYLYAGHSIFTAEVASTVNEVLLIKYLLKNCDNDEMRAYLINFYIDEFKSTLFRQTMFADFEKTVHEIVENGGSLSAERLNLEYAKLNSKFFGPSMLEDDFIQYEWSRIPHFYRDFYVYQYATGYSAANAIADKILTEGGQARDNYLKFLSLGNSDYPINLLKIAGVDMSSPEPVNKALSTFSALVDELDSLIK